MRPMRSAISPGDRPTKWAQHDHVALILAQRLERLLESPSAVLAHVISRTPALDDLFAEHLTALAQRIERHVARHLEDPREERNVARLVPVDHRDQPYEHGLGDVLGIVGIAQDAQHVAVDVVLVAEVEEANGIVVARLRAHHRPRDRGIPVVLLPGRASAKAIRRRRLAVVRTSTAPCSTCFSHSIIPCWHNPLGRTARWIWFWKIASKGVFALKPRPSRYAGTCRRAWRWATCRRAARRGPPDGLPSRGADGARAVRRPSRTPVHVSAALLRWMRRVVEELRNRLPVAGRC